MQIHESNTATMFAEAVPIPQEYDRYYDLSELKKTTVTPPINKHYPLQADRLHIPYDEWEDRLASGEIDLFDARYNVSNYPNRLRTVQAGEPFDPEVTPENPINPERTETWRRQGLQIVGGLALHPLAELGLTTEFSDDKRLAMATGIGRERLYGPIDMGNLIIERKSKRYGSTFLTVKVARDGKERGSFPGGYPGLDVDPATTALREANEETGIISALEEQGVTLNDLAESPHKHWRLTPAIEGPCTLNTWLVEHFLAIDATSISGALNRADLRVKQGEITSLHWRPWTDILTDAAFLDAHKKALQAYITQKSRFA